LIDSSSYLASAHDVDMFCCTYFRHYKQRKQSETDRPRTTHVHIVR